MNNTALIGGQWGDEGKGKIVDVLGDEFDITVRYQGGENAGHTVEVDGETFFFHLLPSGVVRNENICVIGNGVVLNPETLIDEIDRAEESGYDLEGRLMISERAHMVLPFHKELDKLRDSSRIGTTCKGIGPTYEDKMGRRGLRTHILTDENILKNEIRNRVRLLKDYSCEKMSAPDADVLIENFRNYADCLKKYIKDTSLFLNTTDKTILFEGAQGTMLDIDHGTYPYVTSSNCSTTGISSGTGMSSNKLERIIGLFKAYCTRVGKGPFPSELKGKLGNRLRKKGEEFGTTTGRPRRCGWFDTVAARYSSRINNFDEAALSKLDILDGLEEIAVCTKYRYKDSFIEDFPAETRVLENCEPVYKTFKGWESSTEEIRTFDELPENAKEYIYYLEELLDCPITFVSVGPGREQCIVRDV